MKAVMERRVTELGEKRTLWYFALKRITAENNPIWDCSNIIMLAVPNCEKVKEEVLKNGVVDRTIIYYRNPDTEHKSFSVIEESELNTCFSGVKMVRTDNDIEAYKKALIADFEVRKEEAKKSIKRYEFYINKLRGDSNE